MTEQPVETEQQFLGNPIGYIQISVEGGLPSGFHTREFNEALSALFRAEVAFKAAAAEARRREDEFHAALQVEHDAGEAVNNADGVLRRLITEAASA